MWTWRCDGYYHQIAAIKQAVHDAVDKLTSAGAKDLALLWPLSLPRLPGIKSSWLEDSSSEVMECGGCPAVRSFSDSDCVPFVSYTFTLAFLLLADSSIVTDCSGCETPRFDFYHHSFLSTSTAQFVHYHVQIYWCSLVLTNCHAAGDVWQTGAVRASDDFYKKVSLQRLDRPQNHSAGAPILQMIWNKDCMSVSHGDLMTKLLLGEGHWCKMIECIIYERHARWLNVE